jgi:hypothetical protein
MGVSGGLRRRAPSGPAARLVLIGLLVAGACSGTTPPDARPRSSSPVPARTSASPTSEGASHALPRGVTEPPRWLGERILPVGDNGLGIASSTPRPLRERRFATTDLLLPPDDDSFTSSVGRLSRSVARRSTWQPGCPVAKDSLTYITMTFWGFDQEPHTGELIVHRSVARDVVTVFRALYRARWPIEEMRVTSREELDLPPTGDGNNTSAFVCRPARLSEEWSQHAYGLAVDVNPFHNPYVSDEVTLPELAIAYRDREWRRPGMIHRGDPVTSAFAKIGWSWGGDWTSAKDWMHFSRSGT